MDFLPAVPGHDSSNGNEQSRDSLMQETQQELPFGTMHRVYGENPGSKAVAPYREDMVSCTIAYNTIVTYTCPRSLTIKAGSGTAQDVSDFGI